MVIKEVGVADMITMDHLSEDLLLSNLELRFQKDIIYTYTGSILVAVNPYQELDIYSQDVALAYTHTSDKSTLPPHVFAVADSAYVRMREEAKNQSILISGESGSGKTETTKLILRFLASRNNKHSKVEQMLLEISPILESFGNAKTVRNDNSSRFGKFVEVCFGTETEGLVGAKIAQYLLEKSRVVHLSEGERNYHVFYQMIAGMSSTTKEQLKLAKVSNFNYLQQGGCVTIDGLNDGEEFHNLLAAFRFLSFSDEKQTNIFRVLASILHLGNLTITKHGREDEVVIQDDESLSFIAGLLGVDSKALKQSFMSRKIVIRGASTVIQLKISEALDTRDALAKYLYGQLFNWLVRSINELIDPPECLAAIGILDIFGFEDFKQYRANSFEQLCINFCNEKLQHFFNQYIFKLEQQEYVSEKISWQSIDFSDNQECLSLIEKKPLGIFPLLDEECRFPQSSDTSLLQKLHKNCEKNPCYELPKLEKTTFGVKHYAGLVKYEVAGFLDKNKDSISYDLLDMISKSSNPLVRDMFDSSKDSKAKTTVASQFKDQLNELMSALAATTPSFIRCIKPNLTKARSKFDSQLVMQQLKYCGMLETVKMRKNGYGERFLFAEFVERYKILFNVMPPKSGNVKAVFESLCQHLQKSKVLLPNMWQKGVTKIFLRDKTYNQLEELRVTKYVDKCLVIQKHWRRFVARRALTALRVAARIVQTRIRKQAANKMFIRSRQAAVVLQTVMRKWKCRKEFTINMKAEAERKKVQEEVKKKKDDAKKKVEEETKLKMEREKHEREVREREEKERAERADRAERDRLERERVEKEKAEREKVERAEREVRDKKDKQEQEHRLKEREERENRIKQEATREEGLDRETIKKRHYSSKRLFLTTSGSDLGIPPEEDKPLTRNSRSGSGDFVRTNVTVRSDSPEAIPRPKLLHSPSLPFIRTEEKASGSWLGNSKKGIFNTASKKQLSQLILPRNEPDSQAQLAPNPLNVNCSITSFGGNFLSASILSPSSSVKNYTELKDDEKSAQEEKAKKVQRSTLFKKTPSSDISKTTKKLTEIVVSYIEKKTDTATVVMKWSMAKELMKIGLEGSEVRDEIFTQICKEMDATPDSQGKIRGWELMEFSLCTFPPTKEMEKQLLERFNLPQERATATWVASCLFALQKIIELGPRKMIPSELELESIKIHTAQSVDVHFMYELEGESDTSQDTNCGVDSNFWMSPKAAGATRGGALLKQTQQRRTKNVQVGSFTPSAEVTEQIMELLGLEKGDHQIQYGLYEVFGDLERIIWPQERICDIISKWESYKQTVGQGQSSSYHILFKQQLFLNPKEEVKDKTRALLTFNSGVSNVLRDQYAVTEDTSLTLAALQITFSPMTPIARCFPRSLYPRHNPEEWETLVNKRSLSLETVKIQPEQARSLYLEYMRELPLYGSTVFAEKDITVAINVYGFHIVDPSKRKIQESVSFSQFTSWNFRATTFYASVNTEYKILPTAINFHTLEGANMVFLCEKYSQAVRAHAPYARAIQPYTAPSPDYLSVKIGDLLTVLYRGKNGGDWTFKNELSQAGRLPLEILVFLFDRSVNLEETGKWDLKPAGSKKVGRKKEEIALSTYRTLSISSFSAEELLFDKFAKAHFRAAGKKGKTYDITKRRSFSKEPIGESLLDLPPDLCAIAAEMFVDILKYMNEYNTSIKDKRLFVQEVMQQAIERPPLRDELYCQIVKQTTLNPKPKGSVRAWQLMEVACSCVSPSPRLLGYVISYLQESAKYPDIIGELAQQSKVNLANTRSTDRERTQAPSLFELDCTTHNRKLVCHVHLPSLGGGVGAQGLAIPIKPFTRANDVLVQISDILRLTPHDLEGYYLFAPIPEVYPQYTAWRSLKHTELITDSWRAVEKKYPSHNSHLVDKQQPALHLRRKIVTSDWPNMEIPQHPVLAQLELEQAAHDVFTGKFPCNLDQATRFAALYLQATTGDISTKNYVNEKNVGQFIAQDSAGGKQLAKEINLIHASLSGKNALQTCYEFLINVRSWLFYGSTLFLVEACYDKQNQKYTPMWLSVNQRGLNILSHPGLQPVKFWAIQTISNWNCDGKIFNFVAGNLLKPTREQFMTSESNEIADLMQDYMKFLASRELPKAPVRHESISESLPPSLYPPSLPTIADILPILDGNAHNEDSSKLLDPLPIRDKVAQARGVRASVVPGNLRLVVAAGTPRYDARFSRILPASPLSPPSAPHASPSLPPTSSAATPSSPASTPSPLSSLSKSGSSYMPPPSPSSSSSSPSSSSSTNIQKQTSGRSFGPIKTFGSLSKGTAPKPEPEPKKAAGSAINSKGSPMKKPAGTPVTITSSNNGNDNDDLDLKSISKAYSVYGESYE